MKCVKWGAVAVVVAVGVLLFLNKDDVRRTIEMRQMLFGRQEPDALVLCPPGPLAQ